MDAWIKDMLESELGKKKCDVLIEMLEKSKAYKSARLNEEIQKIVKRETDE